MTKFFIIFIFTFPSLIKTQIGVCPIGFVWGGVCGFGTPCQPSLPPFHCLRGSCCRDQRPLSARLGPIIYPQDLIGINNGFGFSPGIGGIIPGGVGGRFCFDTALNCFSFVAYCVVPIYRVCMITRCARTCGVCRGGFGGQSFGQSFGAAGITGGISPGGIGGFGGISPGGIGGFGGISPGGIGGFGGISPGGIGGFGGISPGGIGGFGGISPGGIGSFGGISPGGIGGFGGISQGGIGGFGANGGMFPGSGIGGLNGLNGLMGGIG